MERAKINKTKTDPAKEIKTTFIVDKRIAPEIEKRVNEIVSNFKQEQCVLAIKEYLMNEFHFSDDFMKSKIGQQILFMAIHALVMFMERERHETQGIPRKTE